MQIKEGNKRQKVFKERQEIEKGGQGRCQEEQDEKGQIQEEPGIR
jgi:hypothetical protein